MPCNKDTVERLKKYLALLRRLGEKLNEFRETVKEFVEESKKAGEHMYLTDIETALNNLVHRITREEKETIYTLWLCGELVPVEDK